MILDEDDAGLIKRTSAITDLGLALPSIFLRGAISDCRQPYREVSIAPLGRSERAPILLYVFCQ